MTSLRNYTASHLERQQSLHTYPPFRQYAAYCVEEIMAKCNEELVKVSRRYGTF
jgi:hypothetical protein